MLLVCTTQGCINDDEPKDGPTLTVGDHLPEFSVTLNNGEIISPQTLEGKISVIVFFNTGCGDCRQELPVIQQLWNQYKDDSEVVIALIAREETEPEIEAYWNENNLTMPFSPQENRNVYSLFAPSVIPRVYISNQELIITASYGDTDMPSLERLISDIESLRALK